MNPRLFAFALLGFTLCSTAQDPVPADTKDPAPAAPANEAAPAPPRNEGEITGKIQLSIEANGKRETRVIDLKQAGGLFVPFNYEDRPPVRTGPVTFLGVATMELSRELSAQLPLPPETGLLVAAVAPDSPAAKAGLMESDVVSKIDDQILVTTRQFGVLIANHKEGDSVKLTYFRKGKEQVATAILAKHEAPAQLPAADPLASITRHLLKIGPDGRILDDNAADQPGIVLRDGSHTAEELDKKLSDLPPEVRSEIEKRLRTPSVKPDAGAPPAAPAPR